MERRNINTTVDPFADPIAPTMPERDIIAESTLAVGKDASLTLAKDQLIILDDHPSDTTFMGCKMPTYQTTQRPSAIPYFNVLSATLSKSDLTISYAKPISKRNPTKSSVTVHTAIYSLSSPHELAEKWTAHLLDRAYGVSQKNKRIKVLINPFGGVGRAQKHYLKYAAPIFAAAECQVDVETTTHKGHAIDIAEHMDINAYDVICCVSGDGLPMESFNGLARKPNAAEALRKVAIAQLPCGSGNAMSWNMNGTGNVSLAALSIVKGVRTPLDLVSITQLSNPDVRTLSFLSQSIGITAESDLGTDNIRWMGELRFVVGFLIRLMGKTLYPVDIAVKTEIEDKQAIKQHYANERLKRMKVDIGSQEIIDQRLESTTALGLPPLRYGNISDPLQEVSTDAADPAISKTDQQKWTPLEPYLNLGNFYCGNMCYMAADAPFFPASLPDDGLLDLITIDGDISRLKAMSLLLDVPSGRFMDQEVVRYRKVSAVRIVPRFGWKGAKTSGSEEVSQGWLTRFLVRLTGGSDAQKEGYFSVDGERLPFEPFQIEVHRGLGTVLSRTYGAYEFEAGPSDWNKLVNGSELVEGSSET